MGPGRRCTVFLTAGEHTVQVEHVDHMGGRRMGPHGQHALVPWMGRPYVTATPSALADTHRSMCHCLSGKGSVSDSDVCVWE